VLSSALAGQPVHAAGGEVELQMTRDSLDVTVDGKAFTVFHFAKSQKKPYFWPVRSPEGLIMTRPLEKPRDHPHHKGLWFTVDEVNGIKFWEEKRTQIDTVSVEPLVPNGNPARFKVINHWEGKDGKPLLIETTTVSIFTNRVLAYDAEFTAASQPVTFGDTKEGMFGFRLVDPLREIKGGKVVNAEGVHGSKNCWGQPAAWVDYEGTLEGKAVGVAIFDNPHNFRPSRYHVRDYGLFSISPFGEKAYTDGKKPAAPVVLKPGEKLRLRYGLYIHDGDTKASDVVGTYQKYLESSGT
jgi:hypothetical protein